MRRISQPPHCDSTTHAPGIYRLDTCDFGAGSRLPTTSCTRLDQIASPRASKRTRLDQVGDPSAKRAVEGDLFQGALDTRELLLGQPRHEETEDPASMHRCR